MAFIASLLLGTKHPKCDLPISEKSADCAVTSTKFTPLGFDSEKSLPNREPICLDILESIEGLYGQEYKKMELQHHQNLILREVRDNSDGVERANRDELSLDLSPDSDSYSLSRLKQVLLTSLYYVGGLHLFFFTIWSVLLSLIYRQGVKILLRCFHGQDFQLIRRPADAVWGFEADFASSNIVFVIKCKGLPDLERIIDDFERKVLKFRTLERADNNADGIFDMYVPYEKLRWIVREKFLFYCWERDPAFNVRNHFFLERVMDQGNNLNDRIQTLCEAYLEHKLDPMKPQWEFRVVAPVGVEGIVSTEYGLIFCVHHSYGDGVSWLQMLRNCLADELVSLPMDPLKTPTTKITNIGDSPQKLNTGILRHLRLVATLPHAFGTQVARMLQEKNSFHGPLVHGTKFCHWAGNIFPLKAIKNLRGPSGNPLLFTGVILSCATKAFQHCFLQASAAIPKDILVTIPYVNLPYKTLEPVNNFSMALTPLPTGRTRDRARRVMVTDENMRMSSTKDQTDMNRILADLVGRLISPMVKIYSSLAARSTLALTNLPGPTSPMYLFGGHRVSNIFMYAPTKFRTGVNIGMVSYCGAVNLSLTVDGTIHLENPWFPFLFLKSLEQEMERIVEENQPSMKEESITIECTDDENNNVVKP